MVNIKFAGYVFNVSNPFITIGSINIDLRKAEEWENSGILSSEGETARLIFDIMPKPEKTIVTEDGDVVVQAKKGIDILQSNANQIFDFLNDFSVKFSESKKEMCREIAAIKFPSEFNAEINIVTDKVKREYQLIQSAEKNINFLGRCGGGVFGKVRLDKNISVIH